MAERPEGLAHLLVRDLAESHDFHRTGGGNPKIRRVERRAHGQGRLDELTDVFDASEEARAEANLTATELQSLGLIIVLEGASEAHPLKLRSLDQLSGHRKIPKRPKWLLLSVTPAAGDQAERAVVWVSDEYRSAFLKLFQDYLSEVTRWKQPANRELVANIARIRRAALRDLWQSGGEPPTQGRVWWELWLDRTDDAVALAEHFAQLHGLRFAERRLKLNDRVVVWLEATWSNLQALPFTRVPLAEIRRPSFVDTVEDLGRDDREEFAEDLAARIEAAEATAPAVCHLDTGVRRTHALLTTSLAATDVHSTVDEFGTAVQNHGTLMAGLALYGSLDGLLLGTATLTLRHRLESVKFLPDRGPRRDPETYGVATAQAVALPEATIARRRVFCMPVTAKPDNGAEPSRIGEPSLWSASVDALAAGVDIARSDRGIELIGRPDPAAARLFVLSAGNTGPTFQAAYRDLCDTSPAEDPAQAWNVLTVGAHTSLTDTPSDPSYAGWHALAEEGDISPHSRTSFLFGDRPWPIKPDICMEGGNVLTNGARDFHEAHPLLSVRTTDSQDDLALGSANATSAATAQAARLAALVQAAYPAYWPETVRGLLVHAAEWTPAMRAEIDGARLKAQKLRLLRRYGWGVPAEAAVLDSSQQAVTLVTQDEFVPFDGPEHKVRHFRLHQLPWPVQALRDLEGADVTLRVTLSYFVEPTASRRGWRQRYSYASHGLRFELMHQLESIDAFIARVNREAQLEEDDGTSQSPVAEDRWLIGSRQRNLGSLHQDVWEGAAADLAETGTLAVHPVGGWWKNNGRKDRIDLPVRYALLVSLKTSELGVDLYTPVATELQARIESAVPAT